MSALYNHIFNYQTDSFTKENRTLTIFNYTVKTNCTIKSFL